MIIPASTIYGVGGYDPAMPDNNIASVTPPRTATGLGATGRTLHYARVGAGPHVWTINGVTHPVGSSWDAESGLYWSEVELAAVGTEVIVSIGGETITLGAA
jgi:hypothetical protein